MSHQQSREQIFRNFYLRRFFRIYPPYLVVLVLLCLATAVSGRSFHVFRAYPEFESHFLLLHNLGEHSYNAVNPSFWSIAVEVQLYLLYPLLLWLAARVGWRQTLVVVGILEITLRALVGISQVSQHAPPPFWLHGSPFFFWFSWSIGAALADDYLSGKPLLLAGCPLWLWPAVTLAAYCVKPLFPFCFPLIALSACAFIAHRLGVREPKPGAPRGVASHFAWVGAISYSVYLIHQPLLLKLAGLSQQNPSVFQPSRTINFLMCLADWPIVLALAYLLFRLVEQPSNRCGKALTTSKLEPVAASHPLTASS